MQKSTKHSSSQKGSTTTTASDQITACALASSSALSRVAAGDNFMTAITKAVEDMYRDREAALAKATKELAEREEKVRERER